MSRILTFQYEPEAAPVIQRLLCGELATRRRPAEDREVVYFDTFDWRVARAGGELRLGGKGPERMLSWSSGNRRPPLRQVVRDEPAFAEDLPRGPLRDELERRVEMRRLLPVLELRRRDEAFDVLDGREKTVARVRFGERSARRTGSRGEWFELPAVVGVEGLRGYDEELERVRRFLADQLDLAPHVTRDLEEAAGVLELAFGRDPSKTRPHLESASRALDATRVVMGALLDVLLVNEDGTRRQLDTEFLHDFRVAVRRARSVLGQIDDVLPYDEAEHLERELRWLGAVTGPLRDLDVFRLRLPEYGSELSPTSNEHLVPLHDFLKQRQAAEQARVVTALDSKRYRELVASWRSLATGEPVPPVLPSKAFHPVLEVVSDRIWTRFRKVLDRGLAIRPETPASEVHRVRIECKKLRNLLELFRSLYDAADVDPAIASLKRLQTNLGDFNDFEVHEQMLLKSAEEMAAEAEAPAITLLTVGRLAAQLEARRREERERFLERFAAFARRKNRKRFRRLFKSRSAGEVGT